MTVIKRIIIRITGIVRLSRKTWMIKAIGETRITRVIR